MKIDEVVKARFKNEHHKALVNIRFTSNWLSYKQNIQLQAFGLSLPQFNIMRILRGANEMLSVSEIKERMIEKSPNTSRLIDKLLSKELLQRVRCEKDRRVVYLQISQKGLDLLQQVDVYFDDINLDKSLTTDEAKQLNDLLDKVRKELN